MRGSTKIFLGGLAFFGAAFALITLATGSPQVGLHAGFWISLAFGFWLEAHISR